METSIKMSPMDWASLVVLSVLWGGSFFLAKIALVDVPPLTLVFLRVVIAAAALFIALKVWGQRLPGTKALWVAFAVMGALNNLIPFTLYYYAQLHIGAGLTSIFNATVPMFTVLAAHAFTSDEKITARKMAALFVGATGVTIMIGVDLSLTADSVIVLAMLACLAAALAYGMAAVFGRRFRDLGVQPIQVAFGQVTASACLFLPVIAILDQPLAMPMPSSESLLAIVGLGLFSTALAYILFFRILARGGATNLSLVTFLMPISAILLSSAFLGEMLETQHLLGMATILAGLAVLDGRVIDWLGEMWMLQRSKISTLVG